MTVELSTLVVLALSETLTPETDSDQTAMPMGLSVASAAYFVKMSASRKNGMLLLPFYYLSTTFWE
jgi:hypothetical protein